MRVAYPILPSYIHYVRNQLYPRPWSGVMAESPFVQWQKRYETGIDFIDRQHRGLIDMINELHADLHNRQVDKTAAFRNGAKKAVEYVKTHFTDEERWMEENGFPGLPRQRHQHNFFIQRLLDDARDYDEKNPRAAMDFLKFLTDWLLQHIAVEDNDFRFFKAKLSESDQPPK